MQPSGYLARRRTGGPGYRVINRPVGQRDRVNAADIILHEALLTHPLDSPLCGESSRVRVYRGTTLLATADPAADQELDPFGGAVLAGGVFVG